MNQAALVQEQNPSTSFSVQLERNALVKLLAMAQGVVERRNTVPILGHFLIEAQNNCLSVRATDTELSFTGSVNAKVLNPGAVTAPAHMLYDIVRKMKDGSEISLTLDDQRQILEIVSGGSDFKLSTLPVAEFPVFTTDAMPSTFQMPAKDLGWLLDRTHKSMSPEETRYYLNGIHLHVGGNATITAVATDGQRLAVCECQMPNGASSMPAIILSRKTVNEIRRLIEKMDGSVDVSMSERQISIKTPTGTLVSRLVDGQYPDYQKVIPATNDKLLEVEAASLAEAVDRASVISSDKEQYVKFAISSGLIRINAVSTIAGSADEEVAASYDGGNYDFGFNVRYLLDICQDASDQILQFYIGDENQAIIIKIAGDESTTYVLMPVRV